MHTVIFIIICHFNSHCIESKKRKDRKIRIYKEKIGVHLFTKLTFLESVSAFSFYSVGDYRDNARPV